MALALLERRTRVLGAAYRLFYDQPLDVVRASGVRLWDTAGREYLDAYNNVPSIGHSHPAVAAAVNRALTTVNSHTRYLESSLVDYAEDLLSTLPPPLGRVVFTCTGSEANDLALRIARQATGGEGLIVSAHAYHGVTAAVAAGSPALGGGVALGPAVRTFPIAADAAPAASVSAAIADLQRHGHKLAALLVDSSFSSDGIYPDPVGWLAVAAESVHAAGGLVVADEVQAGFGRLGAGLWGFARHGLTPDLVTLGKPMGNGLPIGAVVTTADLLDEFGRRVRYFNTFGGTPASIAAAQVVLDVIRRDNLVEGGRAVGDALRHDLHGLLDGHPAVAAIRGAGLFTGVDLIDPQTGGPAPTLAGRLVNGLRNRGVLVASTGPAGNVLKIRPPLVFSQADAGRLVAELEAELSDSGQGGNDE